MGAKENMTTVEEKKRDKQLEARWNQTGWRSKGG